MTSTSRLHLKKARALPTIGHMKRHWWMGRVIILAVYTVGFLTMQTIDTSALQSTNFKFDETSIGTSGLINSGSANFGISEATGDLGVGESSSTNFQIQAGSKTDPSPVLGFSVTASATNFGIFTPSSASVASATFSVMNYTSWGYTVQIIGNAPTNGAHSIAPMSMLDSSQPGTEQFGINLVANTSPSSIGANPDNGQFGFGAVASNYSTPNQYYYVSGDTIAQSPKSSGVTNYTITYLVNVEGLTPGGQYKSDQTLVVLGTF